MTPGLQHIEKTLSPDTSAPIASGQLNERGATAIKKGLTILPALDERQEQVDERKGQICGKLSVLAPLGFGNDDVAPLLGRYQHMHPTLDIELELSDHPEWSSHHQWDVIISIGT
ncbi:hypothetical protein VITU102760_19660 [Vibrio tubiashii]|uniref:hypothetical protein n=1 Tax=Vibrio TaxID=662 RepID=UPI0006764F3A|nr:MULTISPECIES: hypothetical protein [Vibrio]